MLKQHDLMGVVLGNEAKPTPSVQPADLNAAAVNSWIKKTPLRAAALWPPLKKPFKDPLSTVKHPRKCGIAW